VISFNKNITVAPDFLYELFFSFSDNKQYVEEVRSNGDVFVK